MPNPSTLPRIIHFIKYHNAFTIGLVVIFTGFSATFAASPAVRDNIYSSRETVISTDNSRIISADLDQFSFNLKIESVTEDEKKYYIAYTFLTLAVKANVWQDMSKGATLVVSKEALSGQDLGLHVAKQLSDNINYELSYLKRVQELQKERGWSQKIVSIEYAGLVGRFLDAKEKVLSGYQPVIPEVVLGVSIPAPAPAETTPAPMPTTVPVTIITSPEPIPESETDPQVISMSEGLIDEERIRQIIQEMLAQSQGQTPPPVPPEPEPEPVIIPPEPEPEPEPEQTSEPEPEPEPEPAPEPAPEPEPEPAPEPAPEPIVTPETAP